MRRTLPYLAVVVLTLAILIPGLRLDRADWHSPFTYRHDSLLILPLVKATIETGTHWRNDRLGAPGVQELHDFPVTDHLHFAVIGIIGLACPDPALTFNLFYLLTYPLTALTGMFVARRLGLSVAAAIAVGLLYTFLPYHYRRGEVHYFLAAYYVVPLTLLVLVWVGNGRLPFYRRDEDGRYHFTVRTRDTWVAIAVALATASAGAYYAFFACALGVAAAAHGWAVTRSSKAFVSGCLVVGVIVLGGLANHAPTFWYQFHNGRNSVPHARQPEEAETLGLKLINLYMPVHDHRLRPLNDFRTTYETDQRPAWNENREASLGFVGAAGLTLLLVIAILPVRRTWPLGPMATLTLFGVLVGTIGGLGSIFNHVLTPQVRAYNRISVYLAFLAFVAALWPLDRWLTTRKHWVRWPVFAVIVVFGLCDQLNNEWFLANSVPDPKAFEAERYHTDARFFAQVEEMVPDGMVFTLPFVPYPEHASRFRNGESVYDPVRGYLHTKRLRWSFGAMKGREVDRWQQQVATAPVPDMLRRIVLRGFEGLFVDCVEYPIRARAIATLDAIQAELGPTAPRLTHPDNDQFFFDLRPYRERLRRQLGASYDAAAKAESDQVAVLWLNGFHNFEAVGEVDKHLWCERGGEALFVNPTDRVRRYRIEMAFGSTTDDAGDLRIESVIWSARFPVTRLPLAKSWEIEVPPGRHAVRFRYKPAPSYVPRESRRLMFFVALFTMTEL